MPTVPSPETRLVVDEGCERCPELVESRTCIAWGNGPSDADVVVVGEAPGAGNPDADPWRGGNHTGMAYTSMHSGRRIREMMDEAGVSAFYTNAVKCFPSDGEGGNREPTAAESTACRPHLRTELDAVDPAVVVSTGRHATASVFALDDRSIDGFLEHVLEPTTLDAVDAVVVPILHPSYQDVWRANLGYEAGEYRAAVSEAVREAVTAPR